jgi:hypothetical protein
LEVSWVGNSLDACRLYVEVLIVNWVLMGRLGMSVFVGFGKGVYSCYFVGSEEVLACSTDDGMAFDLSQLI